MRNNASKKKRIVVAMSGGVDSAIAAALLKAEGHDVIGVTMHIWESDASGTCCGLPAIEDARKVAWKLGIPHYVLNLRDVFFCEVVSYFFEEYKQGRTPNPCVRCNRTIKFGALLEKARELGADFIASGHHARIEPDRQSGRYLLKKGTDRHKDQSYFLYALQQEQLAHTLMPIGNLTKDRVREMARELDLPVAMKPQSQEICFIPDESYADFIRAHAPDAAKPGPILDVQGNLLGQHRGIIYHTIGQRKGLGIAAEKPLYVTAIDPRRNAIIVGTKAETYSRELVASELNWIAIARPAQPLTVKAKVRYRHPETEATVTPLNDRRARVVFSQPQMAITPGQAVVFYHGDSVLGGGTIEMVTPATSTGTKRK